MDKALKIVLVLCAGLIYSCASVPSPSSSGDRPAHSSTKAATAPPVDDLTDRSDAYHQYVLGMLAERKGKYREAVKYYLKAVSHDEKLIQGYQRSSVLLLRMGKISSATKMAKKALKLDPDYVPALIILGSIASGENRPGDAIEYYHHILEIDPEQRDITLSLAVSYLQNTQYDQALIVLKDFQKKFDDDSMGQYFLGRAYAGLKKIGKAEEVFENLIKKFPRFVRGYEGLALIYRYQKRYDEAGKVYKRYLQFHPTSEFIRKKLADLHLRQGLYEDAQKEYREMLKGDTDDIELHFKLGITHWRQAEVLGIKENYNKALEHFQLVRIRNPNDKRVPYYIATIFERLDLIDEAIENWKQLDTGEKDTRDIYLKIAELYEKSGNEDMSLQYAIKATELDPNDPELFYFVGLLSNKLNRSKAAEKAFKNAIILKKDEEKYYFHLGVAYERMKEYDRCIDVMKIAIGLNPKHANALNYLGYIYAEQGTHLDEAEKQLILALEIEPDNGYFLDSLAWIYYKQKKYEKALKLLLESVRKVQPDPTILEHLGDVYLALDNLEKALNAFEASLAAEPDDGRDLVRTEVKEKVAQVKEKLEKLKKEK